VRRRELGTRLRKLRTRSGHTQEEVAEQLECSTTKISRIETAARESILRDIPDLCHIYGVTCTAGIEIDELMDLAREAWRPARWIQYSDRILGGPGLLPPAGGVALGLVPLQRLGAHSRVLGQ
jgi:transcriptional regulator with XRE-family HTH domain